MKKSKKLISLLMTVVFITQIFFSSGAVFSSAVSKTQSEVGNTPVSVTTTPTAEKTVSKAKTSAAPTVTSVENNKQAVVSPVVDNSGSKSAVSRKDRIIVKYKDMSKAEDSKKRLTSKKSSRKLSSKKSMSRFKMESLEVTSDEDVSNVINDLKSDPNVEYAQPDYLLDTFLVPQDERYNEQWGLSNNGQAVNGQFGTSGVDINAVNAWDISTGSNSVTVAVVDTGVDTTGIDLKDNIYVNSKEQLNGKDDDGNGLVDDVNGWNYANNNNSVYDDSVKDLHGTHVAGIIAAELNNGGVTGVAPKVKILPVKFIDGNAGYTADAISAIQYAVNMGATIINCSWGCGEINNALKDVMANSNAIFICAAGNSGKNVDTSSVYPACYDLPNIISVAALDNKGELASYSNYGNKVHIAAPGSNILSTLPGNKYGYLSGTSMAAPFVTGVAALLKSKDPILSVAEIKARILNNATKMQNLSEKVYTSGRLNADAALLNNTPSDTVEPTQTAVPTPTENPKSKEPGIIYDTSASGNNKIPKPIVSQKNLFIDSAINDGIEKMSSGNGIENLGIYRIKEKSIAVIWTTSVDSNTELHYGNTNIVERVYKSEVMTTKHQAEIMIDSVDDFKYFTVKSVSKDGAEFTTDIKETTGLITDLGGSAPVLNVDTTGNSDQTSMNNISAMSYMADDNANHSFDTAQSISRGTIFGAVEQGTGSDYYSISLTADKTYSISLIGMAQGEDYDLYLYNSSKTMINFSNVGSNYDDNIGYTPSTTDTYYLQIMPYTISSTAPNHNYQLVINSVDCPPDSYEPNDGKSVATSITAGNTINATLNVDTDEDWYVLNTSKTGKTNITLKNIPSSCDYDLELYKDGSDTPIGGSYSSLNHDEKIAMMINTPGKYYVRVYHFTGSNPSAEYALNVNVFTPDNYEINDDAYDVLNTGTPSINIGSYTSATIDNPDDTDFYKFHIGSSTNVGVRLQSVPEGTDYDLAVYSYGSSTNEFVLLSSSTYGSNSDEAVISQLATGDYYIKVYPYSGNSETQSYKLIVTDDDNAGMIKIDLDKTSAEVGDIITATLLAYNVNNIDGYQASIKYDPSVLQPIDEESNPYKFGTLPQRGSLLNNDNYNLIKAANNNISSGNLNFMRGYFDNSQYKSSGKPETTGSLAIIKFKVLKKAQTNIVLENSEFIPSGISGTLVYDWDGNPVSGYNVNQAPTINEGYANTQSIPVNAMNTADGFWLNEGVEYNFSGYINNNSVRSGISVVISPVNGSGASSNTVPTETNGYFSIEKFKPTSSTYYKMIISKKNCLTRTIKNLIITKVGYAHNPITKP